MFDGLRAQYRALFASRSGTRFRRQNRRWKARPHRARTILAVFGGMLLLLVGIVMLVTPGPGLLVIVAGAALIAGESLLVARWLDRFDFYASTNWARWRAWRSEK